MTSERKFIAENIRRVLLKEYLMKKTERAGFGDLDIQRTPLGTRVTLVAERPGLVIGRKGGSIKELTRVVEDDFKFDNPQIEVQEADNPSLNPQIMAQKLVSALERGWHFRRAGHSTVRQIMSAGAKGCQVIISGKLTGQRHRVEKFKQGHIKFCGEPKKQWMLEGFAVAKKKLGVIGVKVQIMDPNAKLPDEVEILPDAQIASIIKAREEELAAIEAKAAAEALAAAEAEEAQEPTSKIEIKTEDGEVIAPEDVIAITAEAEDKKTVKKKRKKTKDKKEELEDEGEEVEMEGEDAPVESEAVGKVPAAAPEPAEPAETPEPPAPSEPVAPSPAGTDVDTDTAVDAKPADKPAVAQPGPAEADAVAGAGETSSGMEVKTTEKVAAEPESKPEQEPIPKPEKVVKRPVEVKSEVQAEEPESEQPKEEKGELKVSEKGDENAE